MAYFLSAIILSLVLHLGLFWALEEKAPFKATTESVVVDYKESPSQSRQIVRQPEVKDSLLPPLKPKYLSAKNQRVEKETRAAQTGMTQNRPNSPSRQKNNSRQTSESSKTFDNRAQSLASPPGISTVGEKLNEVAVGHLTALNTERFVYYTFFSRVEDRVRFHWERSVDQALDYLSRTGHVGRKPQEFVTEIEILIDSHGEFRRALVHRTSGVVQIDDAPAYAFRKGSPFLNPPKELVQDDGLIHLHYGFFVQWDPSWFARQN